MTSHLLVIHLPKTKIIPMKKIWLFFLFAALNTISFSATIKEIERMSDANVGLPAVEQTGKKRSLTMLSEIPVKEFDVFTNREMSFFNGITLGVAQRKLKKGIAENGTIKKKLRKFLTELQGDQTGFHTGGFILGFLVGLPGVLVSYIIKDNSTRRRVKWSWIGFASRAVIVAILFYAMLS